MKKSLSLILTLLLCFALTACNGQSGANGGVRRRRPRHLSL